MSAACGIYQVEAFQHNGIDYVTVRDLVPSVPLPGWDPVAELLEDEEYQDAILLIHQMRAALDAGKPAFWDTGFSTQPDDLKDTLFAAYRRARESVTGIAYTSDKGLAPLLEAAGVENEFCLDEVRAFSALLSMSTPDNDQSAKDKVAREAQLMPPLKMNSASG